MASPVLHIKDSYYFEVPKALWPVRFSSKSDLTGSYETWLRLDPQFQLWEAEHFYDEYAALRESPPAKEALIEQYVEWKHDHAHAGKPFWRFIAEEADREWYQARAENESFQHQWRTAIEETSGPQALAAFRTNADPQWKWSHDTLEAYSHHLSGKLLIPQPFARLRNLYQKEWGFAISKFMLIEVAVALVLWGLMSWLGRRVSSENRPRGTLWNLLEVFVVFVRDEIARPVIGHHEKSAHPTMSHAEQAALEEDGVGQYYAAANTDEIRASHAHGAAAHGHGETHDHGESHEHGAGHEHGHEEHDPQYDADRFVPLLLTIFFFVLGCNLAGMLPWVGAPTGEWGTTSAIAIVTFGTGILFGIKRFGVLGYLFNQIPHMDLPLIMAVVLKPMIFAIEILGLCIKHAILSIRLLANMVAGHIVLLSIMALAFSVEGAQSDYWSVAAGISIAGSVLLSCLELFVAFLQAYIFTFLSAMFIGAAIHSH